MIISFKNILIIITLTLLSGVPYSYSQNKLLVNLDDALSLAMKYNSELAIAKLEKQKADYKISEVYADNLIPTINFGFRYARAFKKQMLDIFGQRFELGADNAIAGTFDVSEPIPILGTPIFTGIRIAQLYAKVQDENIKQVEAKVRADVKKSFYGVLLLNEVVDVNRLNLSNAEENLRVVEARYKAGVAMEFDLVRAKVKVATIKPQLDVAVNNYLISKKNLKINIGLKTNEELEVSGSLDYDSAEVFGSLDNIITKIANENVAIRQLKIGRKINDEMIDIDRSNFMPKLYLFGQYSIQAAENDDRSLTSYRYFNILTAGIGLSWNLNFLRHKYKEDQSIIDSKKTDEQIANVKERLKTQAESILMRLEDAKKRIIAQKETVTQAERGLELARISFLSGVLNQIDVIDAELTLSQVRLAYLQAIVDYLQARTDLEQLLEIK
jgi:outer membrane protein